jgi:L-aspartate oxidase
LRTQDQLFVTRLKIPEQLLAPLIPFASIDQYASTDVIVIGAGVAGLAFALSLPPSLNILLLTKGRLGESNTRWAQGGLSAAIGPDDSPALHETDTLYAGAGLSDPIAAHELVNAGPDAVDWLLSLGTAFDRDEASGEIALGREAAHSRRRVLHAGGDATGAEIERALVAAVRSRANIEIHEFSFAIDLIVEESCCVGAVVAFDGVGPVRVNAQRVVLAAGGAGQLWATTSNPAAATADGIAIAIRAVTAVTDLEFCQFHPTVLQLPGETPFLVSEAVRGEGAYLRGKDGERFMMAAHELAELAPRDVVTRGNLAQMMKDGTDHVLLDLRHLDPDEVHRRFPSIASELDRRGLDLATDLIPVAPAAHYFMGGVVAGDDGRTSLPGLLAIGEAACTGVHGANRLASNSLLEGLVFGRIAAQRLALEPATSLTPVLSTGSVRVEAAESGMSPLRMQIQRVMSEHVSVVRNGDGLANAVARLNGLAADMPSNQGDLATMIDRNMLTSALAISIAALMREESRGAHYRTDYPAINPALESAHYVAIGNHWRVGPIGSVLTGADA